MPIFLNVFDKKRFIKLLFVCNSRKSVVFKSIQGQSLDEIDRGETLVDIGIYCLVPNHFHLLIKEKTENGISEFVKKVATGYSMYFNKKYERTGSLFEGPFKAKRIDTDEYLKYIFSYIHLNPIKIIDSQWKENKITDRVKAKNYLQKYPYSSYFEYIGGKRQEEKILEKDSFPEYFSQPKEFDDFINDWLSFNLIN